MDGGQQKTLVSKGQEKLARNEAGIRAVALKGGRGSSQPMISKSDLQEHK